MQIIARPDRQRISRQSMGVRVMLLTDRPEGQTALRLATYGSLVEIEDEFFAALSRILDDPMGYDLFVMDCDAFGGIDAAERAVAALIAADARMLGRRSAVCLPDAVSEAGFRQGFDHVLRDRAALTMM